MSDLGQRLLVDLHVCKLKQGLNLKALTNQVWVGLFLAKVVEALSLRHRVVSKAVLGGGELEPLIAGLLEELLRVEVGTRFHIASVGQDQTNLLLSAADIDR